MKKHKVKKIKGVKIVSEIKGEKERPSFPRSVVFSLKTKYDRKREKAKLRREDE